jgi:hypothetical protein
MDFDVKAHPSLADYFSGVLWEAELPVGGFAGLPDYGAQQLQELKKRFPAADAERHEPRAAMASSG